jgi:peptide-methionine (S)-S-oxide reductase
MTLRLFAASLGLGVALFAAGATAQEKSGQPTPNRDDSADAPKSPAPKGKSEGRTAKGKASADASNGKGDKASKGEIEKATFGGGCFWCMEAMFEQVKGVKAVVSGYTGGRVPNPSYEMVHTGLTGHAEAIQIQYDPAVVSYETLLKIFFSVHDPTTPNQQGDDYGPQYRSVIFFHNDEQKDAAEKMYKELTQKRAFRAPIVTELAPATEFYPAEPYHQNYYRNNRLSEYSLIYITPKLKKLKPKLSHIQDESAKQAAPKSSK